MARSQLVACRCFRCGYLAWVAPRWIEEHGAPHCPAHGEMASAAGVSGRLARSFRAIFRREFGCSPDRPCAACADAPTCQWLIARDAMTLDVFPPSLRPFMVIALGIDASGELAELPKLTGDMAEQFGCPSVSRLNNLLHCIGVSRRWRKEFRRNYRPGSMMNIPPKPRLYLRLLTGLDDEGHLAHPAMTAADICRRFGLSPAAVRNVLAHWNVNPRTALSILRSHYFADDAHDDDFPHIDRRRRFYADYDR